MGLKKEKKIQSETEDTTYLQEETKHWVLSVLLFTTGIFFVLASYGKAGVAGDVVFSSFAELFGIGYVLLPLALFALSVSFFHNTRPTWSAVLIGSGVFFFLSGLALMDVLSGGGAGGVVGKVLSTPVLYLFDAWVGALLLFSLFIISLAVMFDRKPTMVLANMYADILLTYKKLRGTHTESEQDMNIVLPLDMKNSAEEESDIQIQNQKDAKEKTSNDEQGNEKEKKTKDGFLKLGGLLGKKEGGEDTTDIEVRDMTRGTYTPPPLSLLSKDSGKPSVGDIKANANIIKRTLQNFNITVEMDEISIGPSVTRYALKPAEGVKLSRIVGLQNDLSLALAARSLRIEAPIPGKSLVGIEIPNTTKMTVGLGTLFADKEFAESSVPLLLGLGKTISGAVHFGNLGKMPHLLIAGSTGSGKSVTIHTIINSLLFRNSPEHLRFIMIDPKRVELTLYNSIPHLLTPVITDPKKAILALKWAAKEMDRRYDILETESVRDISSYHKNIVAPVYKNAEKEAVAEKAVNVKHEGEEQTGGAPEPVQESQLPEKMPHIVVIIDELADIMTSYPRELESAIVRLAQMSRAVGIHLILSTQRPSVNVITGLIKANIPARIALQVSSQIDSRTILDTGGAEKLLGAGDMLYMSGEMSKPLRIQSAFISEKEVKKVTAFLKKEYENEVPSEILLSGVGGTSQNILFEASLENEEEDEDDELYEQAREIVMSAGKASSSYLQRRLKVGYARAARLLDILEERGVVGPGEGSKPREVMGREAGQEADDETGEYRP